MMPASSTILLALALPALAAAAPTLPEAQARVTVEADQPLRTMDRHRLLGTNIALWNEARTYADPVIRRWIRDLDVPLIRIPGGSWGDITFWNGAGPRRPDGTVDSARTGPDGYPAIDYTRYAPAIITENDGTIRKGGWHGHVDVRTLHEWVRDEGARAVVIVNGGTGRPVDAAEWVRWSRSMGWAVEYWEVGNELDGGWEAGHVKPDGKELTAAEYSARYAAFVAAMKAVDATIKVGPAAVGFGPGSFGEAVLRDHADLIDFFPVHTYPVLGSDPVETAFAKLATLGAQVAELRAVIRRVAPARADTLPVTYTEWNGATHVGAHDLTPALWSALWIGELFRAGVESANEWDAMNGEDGYGLVTTADPPARKAQYWAFWLWANRMGDTLLTATRTGDDAVSVVATRSRGEVQVMLVNRDRDRPARVRVRVKGFSPAARGRLTTLSAREYLWDTAAKRPRWSSLPTPSSMMIGPGFDVTVPPDAIVVASLPARGTALAPRPPVTREPGAPVLSFLLPPESYAEGRIEGWLVATRPDGNPWADPLGDATLSTEGPARLLAGSVRLAEAAGRFSFTATVAGTATLRATLGPITASATLLIRSAVPRPVVLWEFESPVLDNAKYNSNWTLSTDATVRPNQSVARVEFGGLSPEGRNRQTVLKIDDFPPREKLDRGAIRGVFFDCLKTAGFRCADPAAALEIVMQSTDNWWMSLGTIPLASLPTDWKTCTLPVTDERHLAAVGNAMNLWIILRARQPAFGALCLDRAGLMIR